MPVLKQGSKGKAVTELQTKLKQLGFDPKGVDGKFGPGTKAAVIAFQKSKGLQARGLAGPKTMAALEEALTPGAAVPDSVPISVPSPSAGKPFAVLNLMGLKGILPNAVIAQIPETALKFGITSNLRLAHFLAQCALESMEFKATVENLNYRAARLQQIFPKYFRGINTAPYANNPAKIANRVYANRMGNGNEASGDGFKFRGRGYIQLTGRNNYKSFTGFIGEDCIANPDLVATKYPLASAAFFFDSNNIWSICDRGASDAVVLAVSTRVNGRNPHAVPERTRYFKKFFKALGAG
jgi:putative chitinase